MIASQADRVEGQVRADARRAAHRHAPLASGRRSRYASKCERPGSHPWPSLSSFGVAITRPGPGRSRTRRRGTTTVRTIVEQNAPPGNPVGGPIVVRAARRQEVTP
jgi:hypothetical protein